MPVGASRKTVVQARPHCFSIDAFAEVSCQSLLVLWLFQKVDLSRFRGGLFFFWASTLSAFFLSVAAWLREGHRSSIPSVYHRYSVQRVPDSRAFSPNLYVALGLLLRAPHCRRWMCRPHLPMSWPWSTPAETSRRRARHGPGAAQYRIGDQSGDCGCAADDGFFRPALVVWECIKIAADLA